MNVLASAPAAPLFARHVLVCLDRSPASEACLPYAVFLARTFGSAVTLVHVLRSPRARDGERGNDALGWEILRHEAQAYLDRAEARISSALGVPVDTRLEQGRPANRIEDLAREIGADVTVIGSSGESELEISALGGTAQAVLATARNSVLVARLAAHSEDTVAIRHVLVPLDGSSRAESVLPAAARIARTHGAEMLLLHVVHEPSPTGLLDSAEGIDLARELASYLHARAEGYLHRLCVQLERQEIAARALVVRHANERQCLLDVAQREGVDLVILLAHGSACDSGRSFGSVTAHLLGHSSLPLLVLQDRPESDSVQGLAPASVVPARRVSYAPAKP